MKTLKTTRQSALAKARRKYKAHMLKRQYAADVIDTDPVADAAQKIALIREDAHRRGKGKLWLKASLIGFATGVLTMATALPGCAAKVGSSYTQTPDKVERVNGAENITTVSDNSGERLVGNGTGPSGYIKTDKEETRHFYNGATPSSLTAQRAPDGNLTFNLGGGKDNTIKAQAFKFDPKTGMIDAKGVEITGNASEPTRAQNEALDRLVMYWQSRDEASRDVLIKQIETTGEIPKDLAPFVVQLLLGL